MIDWIPREVKLPRHGETVLVWVPSAVDAWEHRPGWPDLVYYDEVGKFWSDGDCIHYRLEEVSGWAYINPPIEGKLDMLEDILSERKE